MSNNIDISTLPAPTILAGVRSGDLSVIRALTHLLVTEKKYFSVEELRQVLEDYGIKRSSMTIRRWANEVR